MLCFEADNDNDKSAPVAIALAMLLIFSGFFLRSFGKGKEEGLGNG